MCKTKNINFKSMSNFKITNTTPIKHTESTRSKETFTPLG